ncbi:MAG: metallophosphoesterase [Verrucomicrobia bacterium]|nr:metallophosphoesterase [Verrucomicrobiota bacterium]
MDSTHRSMGWRMLVFGRLPLAAVALAVSLVAAEPPARLVNLATRVAVGGAAGTPIPGFVLGGAGTKQVLLRAVGPALGGFGVAGTLADPRLSLVNGTTTVGSNDNWAAADAAVMGGAGAFSLPAGSRDAALVATLSPGAFTAPVTAADGGSGVALLEVYDAATAAGAYLVNASTRAFVGTGDNVLIPGFVISGSGTVRLLIRAVGPTLASFGVNGVLADPTLTLFRGTTALATNDNWSSATNAAEIATAATSFGAFALPAGSRDAALVVTLPAGSYSAVVSGVGNTTGTALVEIYSEPPGAGSVTFTSPELLGIPTAQSVTLNLEASATVELYVEYGTSPGAYTGQTPVTTYPTGAPIEVNIRSSDARASLQANRKYYYRVRYRTPGETEFRARTERSFHTQRPRGETFTFTLTADPHLDEVTNPGLFALAMRNMAADNPDFHVDLGDIFMTDKLATIIPGIQVNYGVVEYRAITLRNYFADFCHSAPYFFVLGNHEAEYRYVYDADRSPGKDNNVSTWNLIARKKYFPTPVPDAFYTGSAETRLVAGKAELLENYYAWEWGEALFVVLDPYGNTVSNPNSNPGDNWRWTLGKAQYDWLKQTLQASRARYKFLFLHHLVGGTTSARGGVEVAHRYEWGGKNADNSDGFATQRPGWDMPIHALLVANKVTAVFHGHDHFYGYQQLDGIVYQECPQPGTGNFSTASARDGEYTTGVILPNSGHLRITVAPANAKVEYVRAALPTQETATLKNRDVAHTYTMAPAN